MSKINDWKPEVRSLLKSITDAGLVLHSGDNGEDSFKFDGKLEPFIENLIACDEAHLYLRRGHQRLWVYLVLGNEPGVIASDYTVDELLEKAIDEHYEKWDGKPQPTIDDAERYPAAALHAAQIRDYSENLNDAQAMRNATKLTKRHIGEAAVYSHPDGGSVSVTIVHVTPFLARLKFAAPYHNVVSADVPSDQWGRIKLFPKGAMFFCAE